MVILGGCVAELLRTLFVLYARHGYLVSTADVMVIVVTLHRFTQVGTEHEAHKPMCIDGFECGFIYGELKWRNLGSSAV